MDTLDTLFGGSPPLPSTHWMERYAKASAEAAHYRAALERIAREKYLGNWTTSAEFAFAALNKIDNEKNNR